jgi:hypothetical protein
VAGKDDGGGPDMRACGYFVPWRRCGGAVVPAPVVASSSISGGGGGSRAGASVGIFEGGQEASYGGCAAH